MAITADIRHVFVLMLENRSFDHLLGFSGIAGTDAISGQPTQVEGLSGAESNNAGGKTVTVHSPAPFSMELDPGHEFNDVLEQLAGEGAVYEAGTPYPALRNRGFLANSAAKVARGGLTIDPGVVMAAFTTAQLPVLNALAREFAVCDHWFSSMPGPTWPNRLFVHAASSAGLDDSPTPLQSVEALLGGYRFEHGTVFDRLEAAGLPWNIVEGDALPQALSLGGMIEYAIEGRFISLATLQERLRAGTYDSAYTFIEPRYGHVLADGRNFKCGDSQHPLDDITRGDGLLKRVYEAIRQSSIWEQSLLLVTYDEHGGFYDHVAPPPAVPPQDLWIGAHNSHGFAFDQLGVRVPAVVASPLLERGTIDHSVFDHASVPATLAAIFGVGNLTARDRQASTLEHLLTRKTPRTDCPTTLPDPAVSGLPDCEDALSGQLAADVVGAPAHLAGPLEAALTGFMHVAMARHLQMAATVDRDLDAAAQRERQRLEDAMGTVKTKLEGVRFLRSVETAYQRFTSGL